MSKLDNLTQDIEKVSNEVYEEGKSKAESLVHQFAQVASDLYKDGKKKATEIENNVAGHSEDVIRLVKENKLGSLLIAGSIGFLLSILLKK
jgi:ElaB/YqjD/DUF883 family membrane-anchored ribosome-binding protein